MKSRFGDRAISIHPSSFESTSNTRIDRPERYVDGGTFGRA